MTDVRAIANQIAAVHAHGAPHFVKVRESAACRRNLTRMPAFEVWVRIGNAKRGRYIATVVLPEFATPNT